MSKGDQTKAYILKQSAPLFNRLGFSGVSMTDIMKATNLQKGGIYRHFASKEDLAVQVFDYAFETVSKKIIKIKQSGTTATEALFALLDAFEEITVKPPIAGGCPVLNTAVEHDDTNELMRQRACNALERWQEMFEQILYQGIKTGEFNPHINSRAVATTLIASLEGGIMLSQVSRDTGHISHIKSQLRSYLNATVIQK